MSPRRSRLKEIARNCLKEKRMYRTTSLFQVTNGSTAWLPVRCVLSTPETCVSYQVSIVPTRNGEMMGSTSLRSKRPSPCLVLPMKIVVVPRVCHRVPTMDVLDEQG